MQRILRRVQRYSVYEILYLVLLALLIFLVLPLLQTALYAHPSADDFTYGQNTHHVWEETGSLLAVIAEAVKTAKAFWYSYQGPFASAFFMALHPAVISERLYPLTTVVMLGSMVLSTGVLVNVVFGKYFGMERIYRKILACVLLLWSTQLLVTPFEASFWFCGAVHYVFMHTCMLLLISVLLLAYKAKGRKNGLLIGLSVPLAVCCGGANFSTALLTAILMFFLLTLLLGLRRRRELLLSLPTVLVNLGAFALNVCAPGNRVRQMDQMASLPPAEAIYYALKYGFEYITEWMNIYVILGILVLIPVLWKGMAQRKCECSFRLPGLVTGVSFCFLSAMFAPSTYAMGLSELYGRTLNVIQMTYYLLLVFNLSYWIGWFGQNLKGTAGEWYDLFLNSLSTRFGFRTIR